MQLGGLNWDVQGEHNYYTGIDGVALFVWKNGDYYFVDSAITNATTFATQKAAHQLYVYSSSSYQAIAEDSPYSEVETYYYHVSAWYDAPVAWNGITAVNESPSGAESNKLYADNIEYLNLLSKEEFGLTLECYQVPEAFDACDGIVSAGAMKARGQTRKPFGLVYRVQKGDDVNPAPDAYVYHIVYGCKASPSSRDFATVNDSPEAQTFSYEITTTDLTDGSAIGATLTGEGVIKLVHLEIDASEISEQQTDLENLLYNGATGGLDRMPTPNEIVLALASQA